MKFQYRARRPNREKLANFSASEFKTLLKRRGYKITRSFFKDAAVAEFKGRMYRFRYWGLDGFKVDISCPKSDFDRWSNSIDKTLSFEDWFNKDSTIFDNKSIRLYNIHLDS